MQRSLRHSQSVLFLLAVTCLSTGLIAAPALAQGTDVARILTTVGDVRVVRAGTEIAVRRNDFPLRAGDRVRTGPNSSARVVTANGKRATMGPNSEIEIRARGGHVHAGRVAFWITGRGRTEITTPAATAGADGTGFLIEVAEDGTSTVTVAEGTVEFYNAQGRVTVGPNEQSTARPGQAPSRPAAADASGVVVFEATAANLPLAAVLPRLHRPRAELRTLLAAREQAAAAAPADAAAHVALADVLYDLGEVERAAAEYDRALGLQPGSREALLGAALSESALGRPGEARGALARLQAAAPDSPQAAAAEGALRLAAGDPAGARALLEGAASRFPDSADVQLLLARARFRIGDLPAAETAAARVLEQQPDNAAAAADLTSIRLARGDTSGAADSARRAAGLAPDTATAHQALGAVFLYTGKPGEAVNELRHAAVLAPLSADAHELLAQALSGEGRLDDAVREASVAVSLDPSNPGPHVTAALLFLAASDDRRSERELRKALALNPDLPAARTGLAAVALQRGEFGRALREQKAEIALDQGSPAAHNNLGAAYLAQGHLSRAEAEFKEAIRLQPRLALAHSNLGLTYLEQNRYALALREANEGVRLGNRSARVRTTLARVYMRQNRFDRALVELRVAEALDPFYPLQRFYLAQVYRQQGRNRDAQRALFRGLTLDPGAMVEERLYSRVEGVAAGGTHDSYEGSAKVDGRAEDGHLSYFASGSLTGQDVRPERGNVREGFAEAIVGGRPDSRHSVVAYGSYINQHLTPPGRDSASGGVEDANFRTASNGSDAELMDRFRMGTRSWLTLKGGFRRSFLEAHNPPNAPGAPDPFPLTQFAGQDRQVIAEALLETQTGRGGRALVQAGASYLGRARSFAGSFNAVPGPGVLQFGRRDTPAFETAWAEFRRRVSPRLDFTVGPYLGVRSNGPDVFRPKAVVHYDAGGGNRFAALLYPMFLTQNADLLPVEAWAQPSDLERFLQSDQSVLTNYELTWQRTTAGGGLVSVTGFYRDGRNLSIPLVDERTAPVASVLTFGSGTIRGAQIAFEHPITRTLTGRAFARYQQTAAEGGGALPYFPDWQTQLRLDYLARSGIRSYLALNYIGPRHDRSFVGGPDRELGGFTTVDFRLAWQQNLHLAYFIQVLDLLDRGPAFYRGYHTGGRTLTGGVEFRF